MAEADPSVFSLVVAQRPLLAAAGRPPGHVQGGRAALRCNRAHQIIDGQLPNSGGNGLRISEIPPNSE